MQKRKVADQTKGNLFADLSDEELQECYGQYLNVLITGGAKKDPLRSIINEYLEESPQGMVVAEQRLLSEIAKRHYQEKGVRFTIDSDED